MLVHTLGIPAAKFNDDRLGRPRDALAAHACEIWLDLVHQALVRFQLDVHLLFYDLTALVMPGDFADSELVDYGFAHNTPSDKPKVKVGSTGTGDGFIPLDFTPAPGRTADLATVRQNLERLRHLLEHHGWPVAEVLIIGDRGTLNDELAMAYDDHGLKYLAGLQPQKKLHRELVTASPEREFATALLTEAHGGDSYWGLPCAVTFTHAGRTLTHRGLVVLSGPMRRAVRQGRAAAFRELRSELAVVRAKIGQKR